MHNASLFCIVCLDHWCVWLISCQWCFSSWTYNISRPEVVGACHLLSLIIGRQGPLLKWKVKIRSKDTRSDSCEGRTWGSPSRTWDSLDPLPPALPTHSFRSFQTPSPPSTVKIYKAVPTATKTFDYSQNHVEEGKYKEDWRKEGMKHLLSLSCSGGLYCRESFTRSCWYRSFIFVTWRNWDTKRFINLLKMMQRIRCKARVHF